MILIAYKINNPTASGELCPQTPCFRDLLPSLAPLLKDLDLPLTAYSYNIPEKLLHK